MCVCVCVYNIYAQYQEIEGGGGGGGFPGDMDHMDIFEMMFNRGGGMGGLGGGGGPGHAVSNTRVRVWGQLLSCPLNRPAVQRYCVFPTSFRAICVRQRVLASWVRGSGGYLAVAPVGALTRQLATWQASTQSANSVSVRACVVCARMASGMTLGAESLMAGPWPTPRRQPVKVSKDQPGYG